MNEEKDAIENVIEETTEETTKETASDEEARIEAAALENANPTAEDLAKQIKEMRFKVHFSKPHVFEGQEYKELDLSPIENLTTTDLKFISKVYKNSHKALPMVPYNDPEWVEIAVRRALNKPVEFFEQMSAKNFADIVGVVSVYFLLW